jgi:hypothetical protein
MFAGMLRPLSERDTSSIQKHPSVEKRKEHSQIWYPDLDNFMVGLNLVDDNDTISLSSSESSLIEEKTVRFGKVEIREYKVIIGDHPFCKDGLALSLDWEYKQLEATTIEEFVDEVEEDEEDDYDETSFPGSQGEEGYDDYQENNVDYINIRPKRLNYFERRLLLEQVGFKIEDCYGDLRSSIWVCVDSELPPVDDDDEESL